MLQNNQFCSEEWYKLYPLGYSINRHLSDLAQAYLIQCASFKQDNLISLYEQEQVSYYTISHMVYSIDLFETLV